MALPTMTGEFRVYGEPKLGSANGVPVANVRLVCNKRKRNDQGVWEDDPTKVLWANATIWRKPAENLVASIRDKDLVIVTGQFYLREFEHNGVKKQSVEIEADHIAPSLTFRSTPHSDQQQGQDAWTQPPAPQAPYGQPQGQPQGQQQPAYAQAQPQQGGWQDPYQQPPF